MTSAVLHSSGAFAALAQPRVLLALVVLSLGLIDQTLAATTWLAGSVVASAETSAATAAPSLLVPLVAAPVWLVLREL